MAHANATQWPLQRTLIMTMIPRIPANYAFHFNPQHPQADPSNPSASGSNLPPAPQRPPATMPYDGVWALRQAAPDLPNPHAFIGPPFVQLLPAQAPNPLTIEDVVRLFDMIINTPSAAAQVSHPAGNTGIPNSQGRRSLTYQGTAPHGSTIHIALNIDAGNRLQWMRLDRVFANGQQAPSREAGFSPSVPGSSAAPREYRPAWFTDYPRQGNQFGSVRRRSHSASPTEAPSSQRPRIGATSTPQPLLLLPGMEEMHLFQQRGTQFIEPQLFDRPPAPGGVYYDGLTVDAMRHDEAGNLRSYLERQHHYSCARHGLNALVGGPLVSMDDFANYELRHPQPGARPGQQADILAIMVNQGVNVETVLAVMQERGVPATAYTHTPMTNASGAPEINWEHLN